METKIIKLSKGEYISDVVPFKMNGIPTDSIVHKQITGCGITTFEMQYAKHHSIIILPNVPVIESKVAKHNREFPHSKVLGVYKGVDVADIQAYLLKDIEYKKILTTPEGFVDKLLKVFEKDKERLYKDFFLLYDECERIITDVSYRGKIAAPLDVFFMFENKALVSATTLPFSDNRFNHFDHYKVEPDHDYSKPLTVINTNNVIASISHQINELQSERICIFFNSTQGINAVMEALNIKHESRVFCSQESVVKLMEMKYMHASSDFNVADMAKYNFFTSRYFSALDLVLPYQPDVIMVTDIYYAVHSILDPNTEIIQIAGRFRKGVNTLTHITNFKPLMDVKPPQEALTYLHGCLDTYEHIVSLFIKASQPGIRQTLEYFVKNSPIACFYTDGKRNQFMIDNDINTERVKGFYLTRDKLKEAYEQLTLHFTTTFVDEEYPAGDDDFYTLSQAETKVERYKQVAKLLDRYASQPGQFIILFETILQQQSILRRRYPLIAEAYDLLGLRGLDETGYTLDNIRNAMKEARKAKQIIKNAPLVYFYFKEDSIVSEETGYTAEIDQTFRGNMEMCSADI
jgi:hypothetical protein